MLEIEPGDGPPAGRLLARGVERGFSGWMELVALIAEARPESRSIDESS